MIGPRRKTRFSFGTTVILMGLLAALAGCQKPEGPAERAGKQMDQAVENLGQHIENAGDHLKREANEDRK